MLNLKRVLKYISSTVPLSIVTEKILLPNLSCSLSVESHFCFCSVSPETGMKSGKSISLKACLFFYHSITLMFLLSSHQTQSAEQQQVGEKKRTVWLIAFYSCCRLTVMETRFAVKVSVNCIAMRPCFRFLPIKCTFL